MYPDTESHESNFAAPLTRNTSARQALPVTSARDWEDDGIKTYRCRHTPDKFFVQGTAACHRGIRDLA
jgi:hypothetical protein